MSSSLSSLDALYTRMSALDAKMRAFDPSWTGVSSGTASAWLGTFADSLSEATLAAESTGGSSTVTATSPSATSASSRFVSPLPSGRLTQEFGATSLALEPETTINGVHYEHFHRGIDLAAAQGTPVTAAAAGTVISAGRDSSGAVVVKVRHSDGSIATYGHLQADLDVQTGDTVAVGEQLGRVGMTGNTTGPHLHFELTVDGTPVDPQQWLDAGHLPGAASADTSALGTADSDGKLTDAGLAAFDAVASKIPYASEIRAAAVAAGVDPLLLTSLVRAESSFNARSVSSCGAQGLAQLMPATSRSLGVTDPFDPQQNVTAAARYFANNLRLYGRTDVALAAYQAGKGAVAAAGGIPASSTTRNYISHILGYWSGYLTEARQ